MECMFKIKIRNSFSLRKDIGVDFHGVVPFIKKFLTLPSLYYYQEFDNSLLIPVSLRLLIGQDTLILTPRGINKKDNTLHTLTFKVS